MLWLALHLPQLSLEAFCATLAPGERARPVALLAAHRVLAVNAPAAERGVQPGAKRATALALAADLLLAEAAPSRDAAALRAVAHAALAFTPAVTLQGTQTVLLELQASLRLFGGLPALWQRLQAALAPLGHRVAAAAAPTATGAALLARWQPRALANPVTGAHATALPALQALLAEVPLALLDAAAAPEVAEALQGMGLRHGADLRALPRDGLARRFGPALLAEWDRACGRAPDPRRWLALPAQFDSRLELFSRAENTEQVLHGAQVLLARLVAWAQARQARVLAFTLRMGHERQRQALAAPTELRVELAEPALDAAHLQLLLRERLARVVLAAPALELQLQCRHWVAAPAPNGELFPTRASVAEGLGRLLEHLGARLGEGQVQRVLPVADHRPERASRTVPAQGTAFVLPAATLAALQAATQAAASGPLALARPAWLLPEPLPLAAADAATPLLEGRALQLLAGPERIEAGWWDAGTVARDYFVARTADGSLVWVYRGRLPAAPGEPLWFLQGRFG